MLRSTSLPRGGLIGLGLAALAALVLFAGAAAPVGAQSGEGRVRVIHASPDTPPVDIFVNGQKAISALAFPDDTGYVSLPAGTYNVDVFVAPSDGSGDPALEADLAIAAGTDDTVLAIGLVGDGSLALLPLEDNNATPAAGNAHVRFIHASPDAPAVDIGVAGTTANVFANVAFGEVGTYTPVPAGTYDLEVKVAGTDQVALAVNDLALADRTVYTVVAIGQAGDGTLAALPLVDAAAPAATPTVTPTAAPQPPHTGSGLAGDGSTMAWWLIAGGAALALAAGTGAVAVRARR